MLLKRLNSLSFIIKWMSATPIWTYQFASVPG
jgi:hypothetical protein